MKIKTMPLVKKEDSRGVLVNVFPEVTRNIKHIFYATINAGQVRGNHYHKRTLEWLCVVKGSVTIVLTDIVTREKAKTIVTAKEPVLVEVPINQEVKVLNHTRQEAAIVALLDSPYDPNDPDTFVVS